LSASGGFIRIKRMLTQLACPVVQSAVYFSGATTHPSSIIPLPSSAFSPSVGRRMPSRSAAFNPERIYPELVEGVEWGRSHNSFIWDPESLQLPATHKIPLTFAFLQWYNYPDFLEE